MQCPVLCWRCSEQCSATALLSFWYYGPVADVSPWSSPSCFLSHRVLHHLQACAARQARYWCHPLFPLHPPQVEKREPCLYGPARGGAPLVCVEVKVVFLLLIVALSRGSPARRQEGISGVALSARTCVCSSSCIGGRPGCPAVWFYLRLGLVSLEPSVSAVATSAGRCLCLRAVSCILALSFRAHTFSLILCAFYSR